MPPPLRSLRYVIALNHAPVTAFTVLAIGISVYVLPTRATGMAQLGEALAAGKLTQGGLDEFGAWAATAWGSTLVLLMVFAFIGFLTALFAHRLLASRLSGIVAFAKGVAQGQSQPPLPVGPRDVLGDLEVLLNDLAGQVERRDAALREEAARQQAESEIQRALVLANTEADTLVIAARALDRLVPTGLAELLLADSSRARLGRVAASACSPALGCPAGSPLRCPATQGAQTLRFDRAAALDACPRLVEHADPLSAAVCAPVSVAGQTVGVLHAGGVDHLRELELLAMHVGTRLGAIRTLERTQLQAETDPLTGLLNRRSLVARTERLLAQGTEVAVVALDLDHFKKLNDTYGHDMGDRALRLFGDALRGTLRPMDQVCRYGGEEFVAVLPECGAAQAVEAMGRVRTALAVACARGAVPVFTFSGGVAAFPRDGDCLDALVRVADVAMYQAKDGGRNRILVAPASVPS